MGLRSDITPVALAGRFRRWRDHRAWRREQVAFEDVVSKSAHHFSDAANSFLEDFNYPPLNVRYDDDRDAYLLGGENGHYISNPSRLKGFLNGLEARGQRISSDYLLNYVPFRDGDRVVETGGNDGDLLLALKQTGLTFRLTSFEPAPREHSALSANLARATFLLESEALKLAAWNRSDEYLDFYLKSVGEDSSLFPIENATDVIKVRTARLDEWLPRLPYRLLKLEAEGAEPEILYGSEGVIDCFEYVTVDGGPERGTSQEATLPEVVNFLLGHGFKAVHLCRHRHVMLFENVQLSAN